MDYRIVNVIASTNVDQILDLVTISLNLKNTNYDPDIYLALKYSLTTPKITILVHKKGKIIFCGAKSLNDIRVARSVFYQDLKKIGYNPIKNKIIINNIVVVAQYENELNIEKLSISNDNYKVQYEPEIFPGTIIKSNNPVFTVLLFSSGKLSIVGLKDFQSIPQIIILIRELCEKIER